MSWIFVPELAGSLLDSESLSQQLEQSVTWRGKPSAAKSWLRRLKRVDWIRRLSGRISEPSTAARGVVSWISSLRESRASPGASPESSEDRTTSAISETNSSESFARWNPDSCSWRTCQDSSDADCLDSSLNWPNSGSMQTGACSARPRSAPRISGVDSSSLLPTPSATSYGTNKGGAAGRTGKERPSLQTMARRGMWPTPNAGCHRGGMPERMEGRRRTLQDATASEAHQAGGQLNPTWVEWLMGFPIGWTAFAPSETP